MGGIVEIKMEIPKKDLNKIKKFVIEEAKTVLESVTMPIVKNFNFEEAKSQNKGRDDKQELNAIKEAEKVYNIVKKW